MEQWGLIKRQYSFRKYVCNAVVCHFTFLSPDLEIWKYPDNLWHFLEARWSDKVTALLTPLLSPNTKTPELFWWLRGLTLDHGNLSAFLQWKVPKPEVCSPFTEWEERLSHAEIWAQAQGNWHQLQFPQAPLSIPARTNNRLEWCSYCHKAGTSMMRSEW